MVIYDAEQTVLRQAARLQTGSFMLREDLLWYREIERVTYFLPDLLSTTHVVVLEAFEMDDQDGGQGLNEDLLCRVRSWTSRGVEVAMNRFWLCQMLESVDDIVDVWCADVELQGLVGFVSQRWLLARDSKFGTKLTSEHLGDWRVQIDVPGCLCH